MSNRKENLKKTLGISEYPWSSDDEDNSQPRQFIFQRPSESDVHNDFVYSDQRHTISPIEPNPRGPTRMERENYWSMLDNPHTRMFTSPFYVNTNSVKQTNGSPMAFPPSEDTHDRYFRSLSASDIRRIRSFRKISRGLNTYRHDNVRTTSPIDQASSLIRFKGSPSTRQSIPISNLLRMPKRNSFTEEPQPSTSRTRDPSPLHLSNIAPTTINLDQSDTDVEQQPSTSISPRAAEDDTDDRADDVDTAISPSAVMPEEEEEVVEVQIIPEVEAVLGVGNSHDDEELQDDELQAKDMVAMASVSKPKLRTVKRKRDAPNTNMEPYTVKEFNQSLLSLLECPVCLEWMEPPMSQCRRGHLVCSRCRTRLSACPVCRTAFSSVRNRAMEAVAEMLRYPCRHGCGREKRLRRRPAHEASCSARRYRCPALPCAGCMPLPLKELHTHLQSKHPTMLKNGKRHKFSMKMNSEQHDTWLILTEHELFHLCIDVDIRTWGVAVYVAYIGPKRNASNFTYEVSVTAQHNERKLVYSRVTHSDLESSSLNVSRQDCFHLRLDQTMNFLKSKNKHSQSDKFLEFYVEINKRDRCESSKEESDTA